MEQGPLIEIGLPIALFLIMIGMGLTLSVRDFRELVVAPKSVVYGTLAQILIMPLIAFGLAGVLGLAPALAVGLVLIAACPGGTTSNLFTFIGRGDVALSIILTVLASLITIVTLPVFVNIAMEKYMDASTRVVLPVLRTVVTLVVIILVPVAIGMTVRRFAPAAAAKAEKAVSLFGLLVLVGVIVAVVISVGDQIGGLLKAAGPAAALLNVAGILIGLGGGRLFGMSRPSAYTVAVELGIKNGTLGLMIALTLLNSPEISIPSAVYGLMMFAFGFLMLGYSRLTKIGVAKPAA
ncbi:sodium bile acid symporter family protein [Isoalcanivorax pacificus W11-5]|uniref:Sodium bile acid symporter family protein n=1 Tax=Isoalcanivorax pacificus W11-5 TaxID=391936 RepID=A0A0B4XI16_9GAMM|nr:bile acid:sodium symporter [Isoalcanivorax pacificus]AJD46716.1 sodium bile acid symporter family protein [Isoalcanivorax pacificus W11-5]